MTSTQHAVVVDYSPSSLLKVASATLWSRLKLFLQRWLDVIFTALNWTIRNMQELRTCIYTCMYTCICMHLTSITWRQIDVVNVTTTLSSVNMKPLFSHSNVSNVFIKKFIYLWALLYIIRLNKGRRTDDVL